MVSTVTSERPNVADIKEYMTKDSTRFPCSGAVGLVECLNLLNKVDHAVSDKILQELNSNNGEKTVTDALNRICYHECPVFAIGLCSLAQERNIKVQGCEELSH